MKKIALTLALFGVIGAAAAGVSNATIPISGSVTEACELDMSSASINVGSVVASRKLDTDPVTGMVTVKTICTLNTPFELYMTGGSNQVAWVTGAGNRVGSWLFFKDVGMSVPLAGAGSGLASTGSGGTAKSQKVYIKGTADGATSSLSDEVDGAFTNIANVTVAW